MNGRAAAGAQAIGRSAAQLRSVHASLTQALVRIGLKLGADDPDFADAGKALDALHGIAASRDRAERELS